MSKELRLFLISFFIFLFSNKITHSDEKKFDYDQHKKQLIEKRLLLNSFKKCEEYVNETSVELFLNCTDKNQKKEMR